MGHQLVRDVMTDHVVVLDPNTGFKEIVGILRDRGVSAAPVVDTVGRVLGVVSEGDLLRKEADADGRDGGPAQRAVSGRRARGKARASRAEQLMTAPAVTIAPDRTVVEAARVMERRGVKRLPVVDEDGRLAGIVSRCDLLRVYLRPDHDIREEITQDVLLRALWIDPAGIEVTVTEGTVHLAGSVENRSLVPLLVRLCRAVDGVVAVHQQLTYAFDDTRHRGGSAAPAGRPHR